MMGGCGTPGGVEGMGAEDVELFVLARLRRRGDGGGRLYMREVGVCGVIF